MFYSLFRKCLNKVRFCLAVVLCGCDCSKLARGCESERECKETHTPRHFFYFLLIMFRLFSLGLFACLPFLYTCRAVSCLFVVFVVCVSCLLWFVIYVRVCVCCVVVLYLSTFVVGLFIKQYHGLVNRLKFFLHCCR